MELVLQKNDRSLVLPNSLSGIVLGSLFILLCWFIRIPFYPVSFTMHTVAVFLLALRFPPQQVVLSVCGYLLCHTCIHPHWMMGKCAGYLIALPLAAYLVAYLSRITSAKVAIFCGQSMILLFGFLWLIPFVGVYIAFMKGVVIFVGSDLLKILMVLNLNRKV